MSELPTPMPIMTTESRPFWLAAGEHRLSIPQCGNCGRFIWYPRSFCPHCGSIDVNWTDTSGRGRIYSVSVVRRGPHPDYADAGAYAFALVDLDEGPRVLTNIVNTDLDTVFIGQLVEVVFDQVDDEIAIPRFQPVTEN